MNHMAIQLITQAYDSHMLVLLVDYYSVALHVSCLMVASISP